MKKLPVRWSTKKGDELIYLTPRGNKKSFIFGEQTWYGRKFPRRIVERYRTVGGRVYQYRAPSLSEVIGKTYGSKKIKRAMEAAIYAPNPFLRLMPKKIEFGGATRVKPINYKG